MRLLFPWDTIGDHPLNAVDRVRCAHIQSYRLTLKGVDENMHTTEETKYQVEGGLLQVGDVRKGAAVLQLFLV